MSIKLQPALLAQLEQVAAERSVASEKLLEDAVRNFLREVDRNKIKAEAAAYRRLHAELMQGYLGQYVAIHNGELVDHDINFQMLHTRIRQKFGRQSVLLRLVEEQVERELTFRSPHLERVA